MSVVDAWGSEVIAEDRPQSDAWTVESVRRVRALLVYQLRLQGAPVAIVAEGLGISPGRVTQIAQQAERVADRVAFPLR